jgi:hypothetical protein
MRKVFLEDLPRKQGIESNSNKSTIDWYNSVGYIVRFIYDDIEGEIEILNYNSKNYTLTCQHVNKVTDIKTSSFKNSKILKLISRYENNDKLLKYLVNPNDINSKTYKKVLMKCPCCGYKRKFLLIKFYKPVFLVESVEILNHILRNLYLVY